MQVPFFFMLISVFWIIFSDQLLLIFQNANTPFTITKFQTFKGVLFVLIATFLIHFMIKKLNKKLIQSKEEYKDLFYNTPDPMLILDLQTDKFCKANKAAVSTYGYSTEEFASMSLSDVRLPGSKSEMPGRNHHNIYKHKTKSSDIIICEETAREIAFENAPARLVSAHDITELENAKAHLLQRETQLKQILDSITDGFFILSKDMVIEKANEVFVKIVEIDVEQVEGYNFLDLLPSVKEGFSYRQYTKAIATNTTVHFESFYKKTNTWYRVSAYPFHGGLSVIFRDITNEKQNELRIYQNEQNLLALINNTEDYIWSLDKNLHYFTFNEPYERMYKAIFGEDLWIGKSALNENQGKEHLDKWNALYQRTLNGEKFSVDMDFVLKNACYNTTVRFNPIYDAEKKVIGVGCFLQDVTEKKQHQCKIEQQNEQLKQIAFITSHKVRVPLANILGLAEILDLQNPLSPANREIIEHIKTSAQQLDKSIINMVQQTACVNDD